MQRVKKAARVAWKPELDVLQSKLSDTTVILFNKVKEAQLTINLTLLCSGEKDNWYYTLIKADAKLANTAKVAVHRFSAIHDTVLHQRNLQQLCISTAHICTYELMCTYILIVQT